MKALSVALMTMLVLGCASRQHVLTQQQREEIGRFAVVAVRFPPALTMAITRGRGHGAAKGAGAGAAGDYIGGALSGNLVLSVLLAPLFAAGGAVYGAIAADPSKQVQYEAAPIEEVVLTTEFQRTLKQDVLDFISQRTSYVAVEKDIEGPTSRSTSTDYRELRDVDTVLEIGILEIKFQDSGFVNSRVSLHLLGHARLVRVHDGKILF